MRIRYNHQTGAKTYIDADGYRTDEGGNRLTEPAAVGAPTIIGDIAEFVSPIDGRVLSSRSQVREYEKEHGVRQCGELKTAQEFNNDSGPERISDRQNPIQMNVEMSWGDYKE